jgi:glyoxylase-like metal-dependent hydrolase (beta-lactamase superfamily II)
MLPVKKIQLKIAEYEILSVPTGIFGLDGGAMFGIVPKVLWEKYIPSDEKNRIPMEARALLLKGKNRNILIDTGNGGDFKAKYGEKLGGKFAELYNIDPKGPTLISSLLRYGLTPSDITDVILTHFHFDHAGGATCWDSSSQKIVPTFSNAKYYVQKRNLDAAENPNIREKASYLKANIHPLIESGQLIILEGEKKDMLPGVQIRLSHGHTEGQQNIIVSDEKQGLFYGADLIPTHAHVRLPWVMGYDLNPLLLIQEKSTSLKEIAEKQWYLFFEHDPFMDCCTVVNENGDFKVDQGFQIQAFA